MTEFSQYAYTHVNFPQDVYHIPWWLSNARNYMIILMFMIFQLQKTQIL